MDRCNELCMKDTTGVCTLCEALADRDQCERVGTHAMQRRGVFTLLSRYAFPLSLFVLGGLLLSLTWFVPRSPVWRSTISRFVAENPVFVAALLLSLLLPLFWLFLWKLPQWQVAALPEMKDRIDLESKVRQTMAQILGGAAFLVGLYFTSQTLHVAQQGQIGVAGVIGSFFTVVEVAKIILYSHGSTTFLSALKSIRVYGLISQGFWPPSLRRQRSGADSHRIHPATY